MKFLVYNIFFLLVFLATPSLLGLFVYAGDGPGSTRGRIYMKYEGRQFPLKDIIIHRFANCAKQKDRGEYKGTDTCLDKSCLGQKYCPSIPNLYYTTADGGYAMTEGYATYMNRNTGEKYTTCHYGENDWRKGAAMYGCGFICADDSSPYRLKARFPKNYDLTNFPSGIDFRKGKWKVHMSPEIARLDEAQVMTDDQGEFFHGWWPNGAEVNGLEFEWIPDPFPIAGKVIRSDNGQPAGGVEVVVIHNKQNGQTEEIKVKTDNNTGKFKVENVSNEDGYAVRIPDQADFKNPKTTTSGWTKRQGAPATEPNTPLGSPSYEVQKYGDDDCAGPAGLDTSKIGRCDFKVDTDLPAIAPPPPAGACTDIPVTNVLFKNQSEEKFSLPLTSVDPINVSLGKPEGLSTYNIFVEININDSCSYKTLIRFNYVSLRSPNPTGRPFIKTEGGDVHSNVKIEQ